MRLGRPLPRAFFERDCVAVARDLVGTTLVRVLADGTRLAGRIVETEAYLGDGSDPGSHSHGGLTSRNRSMFGPPGRLYAYRSYGIHTCVNVVCEPSGRGAAVLIRALEPLEGQARMRDLRGLAHDAADCKIASGPGRVAQALCLGLADDGISALRGALTIRSNDAAPPVLVANSTRIGLTKGTELAYRFYDPDSRHVSPRRPGKKTGR